METIEEKWLPMTEFPYLISDQGRMMLAKNRNNKYKAGLLVKFRPTQPAGYLGTVLVDNTGRKRMVHIHKWVARYFIGPRPLSPDGKPLSINHRDGVKTNNCASNLDYITQRENMMHAWRLNLLTNRISDETILAIRTVYKLGLHSQTAIGKFFGVSRSYVNKICTGSRRTQSRAGVSLV